MCSDLLSVSMLVSQWDTVGSHDLIYIPEQCGSKSSVSVSYPGFIARIRALIGGQFLTFVPAVDKSGICRKADSWSVHHGGGFCLEDDG